MNFLRLAAVCTEVGLRLGIIKGTIIIGGNRVEDQGQTVEYELFKTMGVEKLQVMML